MTKKLIQVKRYLESNPDHGFVIDQSIQDVLDLDCKLDDGTKILQINTYFRDFSRVKNPSDFIPYLSIQLTNNNYKEIDDYQELPELKVNWETLEHNETTFFINDKTTITSTPNYINYMDKINKMWETEYKKHTGNIYHEPVILKHEHGTSYPKVKKDPYSLSYDSLQSAKTLAMNRSCGNFTVFDWGSQNKSCNHDMKDYIGFTESYKYCTKKGCKHKEDL